MARIPVSRPIAALALLAAVVLACVPLLRAAHGLSHLVPVAASVPVDQHAESRPAPYSHARHDASDCDGGHAHRDGAALEGCAQCLAFSALELLLAPGCLERTATPLALAHATVPPRPAQKFTALPFAARAPPRV